MSLFIASLNSGSNGNCYYIGNNNEAVLIDLGISCRETEKRMKRLGLLVKRVKAVFVSHEHTDHIYGLPVLLKKYELPVYITANTLRYSNLIIKENFVKSFRAYEPVTIGELSINAFPKFHDAGDPYSFVVECGAVKVGIFTDIGMVCEQVVHHFRQCNAAFLEANYDENMLATGKYPKHLKQRISGGKGHLSNTAALQLFITHRPAFMTHLILSHLSKNNNRPELVQQLFNQHAGATEIIVASRYKETKVYEICSSCLPLANNRTSAKQKPLQLTIF